LNKTWLLDVNVLLAWLWPAHEAHKTAQSWILHHLQEPWASCPITEMGFLRIVTNRSFSPDAPNWAEAVKILQKHTQGNPVHSFWKDSLTLAEIDLRLGGRINGPNQITDAYLLTMAVQHKGCFVTFDYRVQLLAPKGSDECEALLILRL
jgi:toxin-antitoxin system PIN domain toxin